MPAQSELKKEVEALKEQLSKLVEKVSEQKKQQKAQDTYSILKDVLYVSSNAVGSVLVYLAIASVSDKLSDDVNIRNGARIALGAVSVMAGAFTRLYLGANTVGRFAGNVLIGGGSLSIVSGVYSLVKK